MNRSSKYRYINVDEVVVIGKKNHTDPGRVTRVKIGGTYKVARINETSQHDRRKGQKCIVRHMKGTKATVEFLEEPSKSHSLAKVPIDDLIDENSRFLTMT